MTNAPPPDAPLPVAADIAVVDRSDQDPIVVAVEVAYDLLRSGGPVQVPVPRDVIRVDGPDAATYLQGQLSQDVAALAVGASAPSFLLDPSGKLGWWVRVSRLAPETFLLDLDAGFGSGALARLQRFKLRTKATIDQLDGWKVMALARHGDAGTTPPARLLAAVAPATTPTEIADGGAVEEAILVPAPWPGAEGWDVILPPGREVDRPHGPASALEAIRIEAGVPALGAELVEGETIPGEAGASVIASSVSFTKGCYTGQELVARIDSRGNNVPRHVRGVRFDVGAEIPPIGAEVVVEGAVVGRLTSVAWSPAAGAPVALASIGRAVDPPTPATVPGDEGDLAVVISEIPFTTNH